MHHIIYKTTNLINNRYYIGMHSTKNIDDGYLGSGRRLKAELNKYGKENFKREILASCSDRKALEQLEAEIVCPLLLEDVLCLNLKNGGEGGFSSESVKITSIRAWAKPEYREKISKKRKEMWANADFQQRQSDGLKKVFATTEMKEKLSNTRVGFKDRKHSEETKAKWKLSRSQHQSGEKNSSYGTCWVIKADIKPIKIKKEQLDEYIQNGYSRGRKYD